LERGGREEVGTNAIRIHVNDLLDLVSPPDQKVLKVILALEGHGHQAAGRVAEFHHVLVNWVVKRGVRTGKNPKEGRGQAAHEIGASAPQTASCRG